MLLLVDGSLDNSGVVGVRDQTDGNIDLCDLGLEGSRVGDIKRNGVAVLEAFAKLLGRLESSAGWWNVLVDFFVAFSCLIKSLRKIYLPTVT